MREFARHGTVVYLGLGAEVAEDAHRGRGGRAARATRGGGAP